jgi:hypothetical protein
MSATAVAAPAAVAVPSPAAGPEQQRAERLAALKKMGLGGE